MEAAPRRDSVASPTPGEPPPRDHAVSLRDASSLRQSAQRVLQREIEALQRLSHGLDEQFAASVRILAATQGQIVVTGMGKAGLVGQKISATFCSTGSRSVFLHPAEAIHGDLGRLAAGDVVLALSMSGETEELLKVIPSLKSLSQALVGITASKKNSLGRDCDAVIELGAIPEAGSLGLAPSSSTTAMIALGDALALTLSAARGFAPQDFVQFHPGGSLGRKLSIVTEAMRPLDQCRVAEHSQSVRETFVSCHRQGRRTGAVMIVDAEAKLVGLFTDSDLARLLEQQSDRVLDVPVGTVMTQDPFRIGVAAMMPEALRILAENQISELPVVDEQGRPQGMIDITDVIGWFPADTPPAPPQLLPFPREAS